MARTFSRYIWLIDLVRRRPGITFEQISREWERSSLNIMHSPYALRTFHNHREDIFDQFGIEIVCDKPTNSYSIIHPDTEEGIEAKTWILRSIAVDNLLSESREIQDRIQFEKIPEGREYLHPIVSAMKSNTELEMTYLTYWREDEYTTFLQPYFLKVFNQRWYVIGKTARHPEELRVYALDRIKSLSPTETRFKIPKAFSQEEHYRNFFGVFHTQAELEKVLLKATDNQQRFLRSLPLHSSQIEVETHEEYSLFEYRIVPTLDFQQEIFSKGPTVEVLEPQWLRDEMRRKIKCMADIYDK